VAPAVEDSYNFRRVSETVTTSGVVMPEALGGLAAAGYELVVNLLPEDSEHAVEDERAIVERQGLAYAYIPVDFASPRRSDFESFAAVMDANPAAVTHVHCAANYRVSAFYGLYALRKRWWTVEQADEHIAGLWTPAEHPVWRAFIASVRG
jgi:protein tyrosine phosphatase (PTP) superfamily phosphohydrolase (DUF442 family)